MSAEFADLTEAARAFLEAEGVRCARCRGLATRRGPGAPSVCDGCRPYGHVANGLVELPQAKLVRLLRSVA